MDRTPPFVVFSDLDGTLLDHETYSWTAAWPALAALQERDIPLVFASSKTAAEVTVIQSTIGLQGLPAIVENGAGLIGFGGQPEPETTDYDQIRAALSHLSPEVRRRFKGFGDMESREVAQITGLDNDAAALAHKRAFSEPGVWTGSDAEREHFEAALLEEGITAREGGRFLTLSFGQTKADQMSKVAAQFGAGRTVAFGDAPNDIEMLEAADLGVIVANPHRSALPRLPGEDAGRITRTSEPGPLGWNTAMLKILETYEDEVRSGTVG